MAVTNTYCVVFFVLLVFVLCLLYPIYMFVELFVKIKDHL